METFKQPRTKEPTNKPRPNSDLGRWQLPLPESQFAGWVMFFNVASVLILIVATIQTLMEPPSGIYPNRYLAIGAILLQLAVYGWLLVKMSSRTGWPLPLSIIGTYFLLSVTLVCIAWVFNENIGWLLWMYIGQMFGMLTFRVALPASVATLGLLLLLMNDFQIAHLGWSDSIGEIIYWLFMVISGFYVYQLIRASRQRGGLIAELEETTRQLQQEQDKNAELAILQERERLARDMHDGLGHTMAALSVQLEAIQRLYPVEPEKASAMIDESKQTIRESMDSLRRTLSGLRAPGLGGRSLVAALHSLCSEVGEHPKLQIDCTIAPLADQLPHPVAEALWRVAQESLNNVQKHAHAHQVTLSLRMGAQRVILEIQDDGIGIENNAVQWPNRYGVIGMTERMEGLGGTLDIDSPPSGGTIVRAVVKLLG